MTTTLELKVTDGGSVDAAITKVAKLRDVLKETEGAGNKASKGAAAIKSVADAADQGAAKFQKATGALQNFAMASGNPLISKGAAMLNGMAMGFAKVESAAVKSGNAAAMSWAKILGPIGLIITAIGAAIGVFTLFNKAALEGTKYGALYAGALDDVTSSTLDLKKAALEYEAVHDGKSMLKLADALDEQDRKLKILNKSFEEAKNVTLSFAGAWSYVAEKAKDAWVWIKSALGFKSDELAREVEKATKARAAASAAAGGMSSDQLRSAGNAAVDSTKPKEKTGGKSAMDLAVDATNKQLDAQLKLKSAQSALVDQQIKGSAILDMDLVNEAKRLDIEQAQLKYGKEMLDAKGNATLVSAAQATLEFDTKTAIAKAENLVTEEKKKQADITRELNSLAIENSARQAAAEAELAQVKLDSNQNQLNFLASQGLLEANILISRQEEIDLQREAVVLAQGITQAQLAVEAMRNEGKLSEAQITAEYVRQVEVLTAQNLAKTEGINLAARATTELERQRTLMDDMNSLTNSMAIAFGKYGKAVGSALTIATKMQLNDEKYAASKAELMKDEGTNKKAIAKLDLEHAADQLAGISAISGATKDMFDEKTGAHKAFAALEKVTAGVSMALKAQAMAAELAALPGKVAGGVATLFQQGGWAGFAGAAAFLAMMASLGFGKGGGGGSAPKMPDPTGKNGGVLGGSDKQSTALVDGINKLNENNYELLRYSRGKMYSALLDIRDNIGAFAAGLSRAGLTGTRVEEGSTSGALGFSKRSINVTGSNYDIQGTYGGGVSKATASETVRTTKSSFWGLRKKSSDSTTVTQLSDELVRNIDGIFKSMGEALLEGSKAFGVSTDRAKELLSRVAFDLSINTKGLNAEEIIKALEAKVGTELSRTINQVIPGFASIADKYQQVGESSLDFLVRASYTADNVTAGLESIGKVVTLGSTTTAEFALQLAEMMGGIDKFNEQTSFFAENFLSDAERLAPVQTRVSKEMSKLGYASINTREEFKDLVRGLNLSTESGKKTYATLMDLAPAFAAVYEEAEKVLSVEEKLAALKEKELALKDKITAAYESESAAMKATIETIQGSINSLTGYKSSLSSGANSNLTPAEKYALAKSEAAKVAAAAAQGDASAASKLPSVLDNLLAQSKVMNASGSAYDSDFNYVQKLLDMSLSGLEGQKTDAQKQLSTLDATYSTLNIMKEQSYTMVQLMQQLKSLQEEEATMIRQDNTQKEELIKIAEATERLRKQQEEETKETVSVMKRGFMGVVQAVLEPKTNTPSTNQPYVVNPNYYIWNEPTGGA